MSDTRIAVHCYAGDADVVRGLLPLHARHGHPITVMSPEDAPVTIDGYDFVHAGKQQSVGPLAVARQREHMRRLLDYPENYFLMHDADSICLSERLPGYLYEKPDALYSNLVFNGVPWEQEPYIKNNIPRLAMQPPVFASRRIIEALLAVETPPMDGFIDHWFAQAATIAGVRSRSFWNCVSRGISTSPGELEITLFEVRYRGAVFVHSVKSPTFWNPLLAAHQGWLDNGPDVTTPPAIDPREYVHADWSGGDKMQYRPGLTLPVAPPAAVVRRPAQRIGRPQLLGSRGRRV
jgi:hypothetical protein